MLSRHGFSAHDGLDGYVLFDEQYIQYFTGFGFLATEDKVKIFSSTPAKVIPALAKIGR